MDDKGLDFSGLMSTPPPTEQDAPPEQQKPPEQPKASPGPQGNEQEAKGIKDLRRDRQQVTKTLKQQADVRSRTSMQLVDFLKKTNQGAPVEELLLDALAIIETSTGDRAFSSQARNNLKTIYGDAFKDPGIVNHEKAEAQKRLDKLRQALKESTDEGDRQRITNAIKKHEELLAE